MLTNAQFNELLKNDLCILNAYFSSSTTHLYAYSDLLHIAYYHQDTLYYAYSSQHCTQQSTAPQESLTPKIYPIVDRFSSVSTSIQNPWALLVL